MLSGILLLGNVDFETDRSDNAVVANEDVLEVRPWSRVVSCRARARVMGCVFQAIDRADPDRPSFFLLCA